MLGGESRKKNQTFLAQSLYLVGADGKILPGSQDGGRRRVPITAVPVQSSFPGFPDYGDTRWAFRSFPNIRHENQDALYANWLLTWFKGRLETMAGGRLPIAQHQLGFVPANNGQYLLLAAGDRTSGYAQRSVNLNTNYRFSSGGFKGFSVGGTYQFRSRIRQGYSTINGVRQLYLRPDTQAIGLRFGYQRKFQRVDWSTQINITNLIDKQTTSTVLDVNGTAAQVLRPDTPRAAVWTNTFRF